MCNLVFFVILIFCSCGNQIDTEIRIVWIDNKAAAIYLPSKLFKDTPRDSISKYFRVSLSDDKDSTSILGDLKLENNIVFEPLIPFSRGSTYEVFSLTKKIGSFKVPAAETKTATELFTSYPEQDTLPENLLKIYLAFSHPMSEGQAGKYLTIIKDNKDTLSNVFLDLEPELWNQDRTVITIWLDPGRIKRGLQPNLKLGAPLKAGSHYELIVSGKWKDAQGNALPKDFTKYFVAGKRDSLSPDPALWKLAAPVKDSHAPLLVNTNETLDHYLFAEALTVKKQSGEKVPGKFEVYDHDTKARFIPSVKWASGNYLLVIESKLEDLAGNNLNRPFDRDILTTKEPLTKANYEIAFGVNY